MWSPLKNFHLATNASLTPQSSWRILPGSFANDVNMLYMCVCVNMYIYYIYICICIYMFFLIFDNEKENERKQVVSKF